MKQGDCPKPLITRLLSQQRSWPIFRYCEVHGDEADHSEDFDLFTKYGLTDQKPKCPSP